MQITVKLFASLSQYLPAGAKDNQARIDVPAASTPHAVLAGLGVPAASQHLVLVNGVYVAPNERAGRVLEENDAVAVWPPVGGG